MYWATGQPGWARFGGDVPAWGGAPSLPSARAEKEMLQAQAEAIQAQLEEIKKRLEELESADVVKE
jgi:hypothetical protein